MVSLVPDPKVNFSFPYEDTQCSKSLQKPLLQILKTLLQDPPVSCDSLFAMFYNVKATSDPFILLPAGIAERNGDKRL